MRLVQFTTVDGERAVARVEGERLLILQAVERVTDLAAEAISKGVS